ncbi:TIGR00730 family Rossman fold protein [soil metagenome]
MPNRLHICVFCGSSNGVDPQHAEAARTVGRLLAEAGLGLVYGGGRVGLMGELADACLASGGRVVGVIPEPLSHKEIAHNGLTELHVVSGMHERKALMASMASAFLTLPGGIGTLEEFFEILTWAALGLHNKPIGILNAGGYYDPLLDLLEHARAGGFVRPEHLASLRVSRDVEPLINGLFEAPPPPPPRQQWIRLEET